jgi:hypothetical protein
MYHLLLDLMPHEGRLIVYVVLKQLHGQCREGRV